jgi:hypothetical protein
VAFRVTGRKDGTDQIKRMDVEKRIENFSRAVGTDFNQKLIMEAKVSANFFLCCLNFVSFD